MHKLLVTDGAGFIGSNFLDHQRRAMVAQAHQWFVSSKGTLSAL